MLQPATLASMFQPHFQPDPLPGIGLAFEPGDREYGMSLRVAFSEAFEDGLTPSGS